MNLSAGDQVGRFRIQSELGSGGMGTVYRATDERLQRDVAVKVLNDESASDRSVIARFQREAKAVAGLAADGKWQEAEETLRRLLKTNPVNAGILYNHACCLAKLDRLSESVAALRKSVKAGWWNRRHAELDKDLIALRERDDFKVLLELMAKQKLSAQPSQGFRH